MEYSLKTAAETYAQWVAAITGPMGEAIEGGFRLVHPAVQVFEKKPKPDAATPAPEPQAPEPKAPEPPTPPAMGYAKMTLKRRV